MIYDILQTTGLPCAYGFFNSPVDMPYIVYLGSGQNTFKADNTIYNKSNTYQIEYYFKTKNEANEESIETVLTSNGYIYEKSEDVYIDEMNCFVIYYTI